MDIQNKNNIFNLEGNVAIITNCDQELCKAIAIGLAKNGVDIAIASNEFGEMENIVEEVKSIGIRSKLFKCDVSNSTDVKNMVKEVLNYFNHIDILINSNRALKETLSGIFKILATAKAARALETLCCPGTLRIFFSFFASGCFNE